MKDVVRQACGAVVACLGAAALLGCAKAQETGSLPVLPSLHRVVTPVMTPSEKQEAMEALARRGAEHEQDALRQIQGRPAGSSETNSTGSAARPKVRAGDAA